MPDRQVVVYKGLSLVAVRLLRIIDIAPGALDALPHNGAAITLLTVCGIGHRKAYADIFMLAIVTPMAPWR